MFEVVHPDSSYKVVNLGTRNAVYLDTKEKALKVTAFILAWHKVPVKLEQRDERANLLSEAIYYPNT